MDRNKIMKMVIILAAIVVIAIGLSKAVHKDSMSLTEYAGLNSDSSVSETPKPTPASTEKTASPSPRPTQTPAAASPQPEQTAPPASPSAPPAATPAPAQLTGASLNGTSQQDQRILLEEGFYYEPLSDNLRRYITGISYPGSDGGDDSTPPEISFEDLRYVHILHYNFEGIPTEGELICNGYIAQDLTEIFYELYCSEYQLEKVLLIDEYDGDDTASMEDNNTSCFNYRPVEGSTHLSKHALGLAIDINPLYNPYITYAEDGSETILPASAVPYADRSVSFPYKIDEEDLCYKLFTQHGFTWGGHWNNVKDYQHFQKTR